MRKLSPQEVKSLQINILNATVKFCEDHDINYWLDTGTLLGSIRHKGYIPWDDDIDIGMLREDYDRLLQLFNLENSRYKCYSIENNEEFLYPFAKVIDTKTTMYVPNREGIKISVNIDVFVYDNAPDDDRLVKRMFKRRDLLMTLHGLRVFKYRPKGNHIRQFVVRLCRFFVGFMPINYFCKKIVNNSKRFNLKTTKRIGNFTSVSKVVGAKEIFKSFIDGEFEGNKYKIPIGYDKWLSSFYGNYMELPPEEKRIPNHNYEAYIDE